jgi:uncharacterized BrkB/YihY/UPF0761 family membrane protein
MTKFFGIGAKLVTTRIKQLNEKHMFTILHGVFYAAAIVLTAVSLVVVTAWAVHQFNKELFDFRRAVLFRWYAAASVIAMKVFVMVAMMAFGAMIIHRYVIEPDNTMSSIYILWCTAISGLFFTYSIKTMNKFVLHRHVPKR